MNKSYPGCFLGFVLFVMHSTKLQASHNLDRCDDCLVNLPSMEIALFHGFH